MTYFIKYYFVFFLIFLSVSLFANTKCDSIIIFYKSKVDSIYKTNFIILNKYPLANKYFSIVKPELLLFDKQTDNIEKNLIKFLYKFNISSFKKISIGPFQMQINFIENILKKSNTKSYFNYHFKNSIADFLINNLDLITTFDFQCFVLQKYIQTFQYNRSNNFKIIDLLSFYYNSGRLPYDSIDLNSRHFTKIKTCKLSYVQWSQAL